MSKTSIILIIVIVIVVIIIGILLYASLSQRPVKVTQNTTVSTEPSPQPTNGASVNPQDTSDTAINSDLSAVDTQINGLNTDSNNVNQSLNNL